MTGYRSQAARRLIKAVKEAGGEVAHLQGGKLRITGPNGKVVVQEDAPDASLIERIGLHLENE